MQKDLYTQTKWRNKWRNPGKKYNSQGLVHSCYHQQRLVLKWSGAWVSSKVVWHIFVVNTSYFSLRYIRCTKFIPGFDETGPCSKNKWPLVWTTKVNGPRQANLVHMAYASSESSGEPAHPGSLARSFAACSYKQWVKRNLQTESQIPGPSECLGMRS